MKNSWLAPEILVSMGPSPDLRFYAFKRATLGPKLHVSMGPRPYLWLCACKTACLASELLVAMGPSPYRWILHAKHRLLDVNNKSLWVPDITCHFVHAKSMIRTWITSLHGSQPSSVGFACKTAHFGPELQVPMGPRPHQSLCAFRTAWLATEWQVSMGPRHDLSFCARTTAWLAPELQVSMDSSPHLWLCAFKTATLGPNCMCLCVPDITCDLLHAKQWASIRITSLYGSQPSSVGFACKTAWLAPELLVSMGSSPHLWFLHATQWVLDQNCKSLWVPDLTCCCVHAKQRDRHQKY